MGSCFSTQERRTGSRSRTDSLKNKGQSKRRRRLGKAVFHKRRTRSGDKVGPYAGFGAPDRSFTNPAFQCGILLAGPPFVAFLAFFSSALFIDYELHFSCCCIRVLGNLCCSSLGFAVAMVGCFGFIGYTDEAWFDPATKFDSDCDEDFHSVMEDVSSLNGFDVASLSTHSSLKDSNLEDADGSVVSVPSGVQQQKSVELPTGNSLCDYAPQSVSRANSHVLEQSKPDGDLSIVRSPVFLDEVPRLSSDGVGKDDGGILDNCGLLPNVCLPCLVPTLPSMDRKRPVSPEAPASVKKAALKLSFKWKSTDGHSSSTNKKKDFAQNYAAYYPFGVDVFFCQRKIDHIARFVELPSINSSGKLPPILVVNVQLSGIKREGLFGRVLWECKRASPRQNVDIFQGRVFD
ncbi:hypothetical protein ACLOJK_028533 [Asimina triloba]